jgi:hypothetical protein
MLRFVLLTGAILLMADNSFAQAPSSGQCEQVREAVARYGYAAARRHALENYGPEAVRAGDQCLVRHYGTNFRTAHRTPYYGTHYRRHYRTQSW